MTAQIYNLNNYRRQALNSRADELLREACYLYEASLVLAIVAAELQLRLLGWKINNR